MVSFLLYDVLGIGILLFLIVDYVELNFVYIFFYLGCCVVFFNIFFNFLNEIRDVVVFILFV